MTFKIYYTSLADWKGEAGSGNLGDASTAA
jgi:hypothetical protein